MTATARIDSPLWRHEYRNDAIRRAGLEGVAPPAHGPRPVAAPTPAHVLSDPMLQVESPYLGEIVWGCDCEILFPAGLPGFEQQKRMVPVEIPSQRPLIYLQSADQAGICFLTLPILAVHSGFDLNLSDDDRVALEFDSRPLILGTDVLCLALLVPFECTVQSNVSAPIVINLHNNHGVQAVSSQVARSIYRLGRDGGWEPVC